MTRHGPGKKRTPGRQAPGAADDIIPNHRKPEITDGDASRQAAARAWFLDRKSPLARVVRQALEDAGVRVEDVTLEEMERRVRAAATG